jgi:hypothetical protein
MEHVRDILQLITAYILALVVLLFLDLYFPPIMRALVQRVTNANVTGEMSRMIID